MNYSNIYSYKMYPMGIINHGYMELYTNKYTPSADVSIMGLRQNCHGKMQRALDIFWVGETPMETGISMAKRD